MNKIINTLQNQMNILSVHLFIIFLFSLIYYFTSIKFGTKKDKENFSTYENTLYYTTITHFTVGFGDISPESKLLKRITMLQILVAFLIMNI